MPTRSHYDLMLPTLRIMKDQKEYKLNQLCKKIAEALKMTREEENETLASGHRRLYQKMSWTLLYMRRADLVESTGWGIYKITQQGLDELDKNLEKIDKEYLYTFPKFVEWINKNRTNDKTELENDVISNEIPDFLIEKGQSDLEQKLREDLLEKIKSMSNEGFEKLVLKLFKEMGYGDDDKHTGKSGDHGIDGIIGQDKLGLEKIYIQAKKWQSSVGERDLRDFVGALQATNTQKGIFITTSNFGHGAKEWIKSTHVNVVLIDGSYLAKLLVEYDVGVEVSNTIKIKNIDEVFFNEFES